MAKYVEEIYDIQTGKTTLRDFTKAETDKMDKIRAEWAAKVAADQAEAQAKATARAAILDRLGLTADEAAILLG
jgi:hypothetical protein